MTRFFSITFIVLASLLPSFATAGSSEAGVARFPKDKVSAFSNAVQKDLAARGARVAIVGRIGRDPRTLPAGVTYTHVAYWVFSQITLSDGTTGQGYRVYNLYQRANNGGRSDLIQDTPAAFFAGTYKLEAGIIIPDAKLQAKLLRTISGPAYAGVHNSNYSVLANPNTNQFQNCTEHTLNVLMASLYGTNTIGQIKANITAYFEPQEISLSGEKRFFAPLVAKGLTTSDHGATVRTATFGSIARFMQKYDLAKNVYRRTFTRAVRF